MNIHRSRFVDYTPPTVTSLAFSHPSTDGSAQKNLRLAVGRNNGDIELWNPRFGWSREKTLRGGRGRAVEGLVWSIADTPRLFLIGGLTVITEWDLTTGQPLTNYDCNSGIVWLIAVDETGTRLAVGCDNGAVVLVDISGGPGVLEHQAVLQKQSSRVLSVSFYSTQKLIGGCADGRVRVWDVGNDSASKYRLLGSMRVDKLTQRESTLVWCVMGLEKKGQIVSGDLTGALKVWDAKFLTLQQSFEHSKADVLCLSASPDQEKIYYAGVDRKIHCLSFVGRLWTGLLLKLCHLNDIRALTTYESKGLSLVVSGGADKQIVVNSGQFFTEKIQKKLPLAQQMSHNVLRSPNGRIIALWQDQSVKIWRVDKSAKLVARLSLADDENIQHAAISNDGSLLAVGYLGGVHVFQLGEKVLRARVLDVGAKFLQFTSDGKKLVCVDPENDVMIVPVDSDEEPTLLDFENANIREIRVSNDDSMVAISCYDGSIYTIRISDSNAVELVKLSMPASTLEFTKKGTLIVMTVENKLLEFEIDESSGVLTDWSKKNADQVSNGLPASQCLGIFQDASINRVWLWGPDWLSFVDTSVDIVPGKGTKRSWEGLTVGEDIEEAPTVESKESTSDFVLCKSQDGSKIAFWQSSRYKWLIYAGNFDDDEMVVVERPPSQFPSSKAFKTNLIKF